MKYMPSSLRRQLHDKHANVYAIDAIKIANAADIPRCINLIMQAAFFQLSDIMSVETAISSLKKSVIENYGHQGKAGVDSNLNAIDNAISGLIKIDVPEKWGSCDPVAPSRFENVDTPALTEKVIFPIMELKGAQFKASDFLGVTSKPPVSAMGTTKYEKGCIATFVPIWDSTKCVQCNRCPLGCAHAAIRPYLFDKSKGGQSLNSIPLRAPEGYDFRICVSLYDCIGCKV